MKIIETKPVFLVVSNSDLTEGRGYPVILYRCWNKATAIRLGKGKGVQGSNCGVTEDVAVQLDIAKYWFTQSRIESPSRVDEIIEKKLIEKSIIIERMQKAGFTLEEIRSLK